ncbi:MAG: fatty acid desaturase [Gammaproteobacteria bacterium]|nr:fatty acid desaturase [Gammaproteobacteria bacterium]
MRNNYKLWPGILATTYSILAYTVGLLFILSSSEYLIFIGIVLLSHGLVISAYLQHECFHYAIFRYRIYNTRLNTVLSWINGACYAKQEDIQRMHLNHHVSKADTVNFDYRTFLNKHPSLRRVVIYLEWAYIPAVEFITHAYVMLLPFVSPSHRKLRNRTLSIFTVRLLCLSLLTWVSWTALVYYTISYCLFITILRFVDAFQHTFEVITLGNENRAQTITKKNKNYELENTYSNLISIQYPWLNLLTLNFVYHTAHHANPSIPWYQLPHYHDTSPSCVKNQVIPMKTLLNNYHQYRVRRVLDEEYGKVNLNTKQTDGFIGAFGVSFLTDV